MVLVGRPGAEETWTFSADSVSSVQDDDYSRTVLEGDAEVQTGNMLIKANRLELSGDDYNRIDGSGSTSIFDSDRNISVESDRFSYNRDDKVIEFRGRITMVDYDEDTVIRCEILKLIEDDDLVEMQVFVRLIQDDTISRGEFATFDMDKEILNISGNPVVWRKDDEYRAEEIQVNLDTEEIILSGRVSGSLKTKDNEAGQSGSAEGEGVEPGSPKQTEDGAEGEVKDGAEDGSEVLNDKAGTDGSAGGVNGPDEN